MKCKICGKTVPGGEFPKNVQNMRKHLDREHPNRAKAPKTAKATRGRNLTDSPRLSGTCPSCGSSRIEDGGYGYAQCVQCGLNWLFRKR